MEHPAAKSMIEIARTQDEEVGDGTTSVIILGNDTACNLIPHKTRAVLTIMSFAMRISIMGNPAS